MDDKFRADLRERQLKQCDTFWYRAAKRALAGDTSELRNRVAMFEAPSVELRAAGGDDGTV